MGQRLGLCAEARAECCDKARAVLASAAGVPASAAGVLTSVAGVPASAAGEWKNPVGCDKIVRL